jgi:hypothetical protein
LSFLLDPVGRRPDGGFPIISENLLTGNHNSIIPEFKNPDYRAGKFPVASELINPL